MSHSPYHPGTWFTPLRFGVVLAALIVLAFPDVAWGSHSFFYRDFALFGYPLAHYHRTLFWEGELPLWNPYNNCGLPFLAQWNTLTLYPGSLVYLLLPLPWSLSLFSLLHLWLAGMGMFLLARNWTGERGAAALAGIAYGLNGLMLHAVMWPNNIAALAWLPWVVLFLERGRVEGGTSVLKGVLFGTLQMLTGAPEIIFFTWCLVGLFWLTGLVWGQSSARGNGGQPAPEAALGVEASVSRMRASARMALMVLLVGALSAVQLLPFLDLVQHSQRTGNFGGNDWSMPASGWANFFVPLLRCSKSVLGVYSQETQQWTSSYYVGVGIMALAVLALWHPQRRRVWTVFSASMVALLLAMGEHSPVFPLLKQLFPQMGLARYPIKCVVVTVFALPLLAAFGVSWLHQARRAGGSIVGRLWPIGCLWIAVTMVIGTLTAVGFRHPIPGEQGPVTLLSGCTRAAFLLLILGTLVWATHSTRPRISILLEIMAVVLVGLDPLTHAPRQNPTLPLSALKPGAVDLSMMPKLGEGRAMITPRVQAFLGYAANPDRMEYHLGHRRALWGNLNLVDGVPKVNGFFSLYPSNVMQAESIFCRANGAPAAGLLDFMGVNRISADKGWFDWCRRPQALPLITAGQQPVFADNWTTLQALKDPLFAAADTVYLPEAARTFLEADTRTQVQMGKADFNRHHIQVDVEAAAPSILVVAQTFYHCWRAYVDDRPVRIWPANLAFQALPIPAGNHRVRLEYRDAAFRTGLRISLAALVSVLLGWLWLIGRNGSKKTAADSGLAPDRPLT